MKKVILHIDINCFYASVEVALDRTLEGKPLAVKQRNLLVTTNYIARSSSYSFFFFFFFF